ncbi:MAG: site-2 protease family protein [Candidatus Omnitrophica bacterium]|nr:site-2 protease family protein [Candidatus Omnitrophota bacterium]
MKASVKIFELFGISIRVHILFFLLPLFVFYSLLIQFNDYVYGLRGVLLILLVFCCVTFHELCHSLQARHFGVKVDQIILLPIGGVAAMQSIPDEPGEEFKISIAGPLFNITLALVLFLPLYFILGRENLFDPGLESWPQTFAYAFWINPILAIFNLLPAFPMDGGRVLRSFLARKMDYAKATRIAVGFGHTFAVLFGFLGLLSTPPNIILVIIAFFIFIAASQEGMQVELRFTLGKFLVKDVLPEQFISVTSLTPLSEVLAFTLHSHQEDFPVVDKGKLVGLLTRADVFSAMHRFGIQALVQDVMRRDFPTVGLNEPLIKAQRLMEQWQIKAIVVLNQQKVAGVVSLEDLSRIYLLMSNKR